MPIQRLWGGVGGLLGKDVLTRLQWLVTEAGDVLLPSVCEGGINFVQMAPEGQKVARELIPEGRGSRRPLSAGSQGASFSHSSHTGPGLNAISSFTDKSRNSVSPDGHSHTNMLALLCPPTDM